MRFRIANGSASVVVSVFLHHRVDTQGGEQAEVASISARVGGWLTRA
jgi:hypothetical protein